MMCVIGVSVVKTGIANMIKSELKDHQFLSDMLKDDYYPQDLVKEGVNILRELCLEIERSNPSTVQELYVLTHEATEKFNDLAEKFERQGSEFETVAREITAEEFGLIATTYGFKADIENLIAPRDW